MSEVTKKSDTSSSQMRLLGGTPHMCSIYSGAEKAEEYGSLLLFIQQETNRTNCVQENKMLCLYSILLRQCQQGQYDASRQL